MGCGSRETGSQPTTLGALWYLQQGTPGLCPGRPRFLFQILDSRDAYGHTSGPYTQRNSVASGATVSVAKTLIHTSVA